MKKIILLFCSVIVFGTQCISAQQDPNFSLYNFNMNLLNPAYAGSEDSRGLTFAYRKQWLGNPDAPKSMSATYSRELGKNLGLALNFYSDKFLISNRVNFSSDFSYNIQLQENTRLYMGLRLGGSFFNVELTKVVTPVPDPLLSSDINAFNLHVGFGAYLVDTKYYVTVSTPNFIKEKVKDRPNIETENTNFYMGGGYHIDLNEDLVLTPRIMMRLMGTFENTYDVGASLDYQEKLTFGTNYRIDEMVTLYGLIDVVESLRFGVSYDITTSNLSIFNSDGSLDLIIRYIF